MAKLKIQSKFVNIVPKIANLLRNVKDKKEIKKQFFTLRQNLLQDGVLDSNNYRFIVFFQSIEFWKILNSIKATKTANLPRNILGKKEISKAVFMLLPDIFTR